MVDFHKGTAVSAPLRRPLEGPGEAFSRSRLPLQLDPEYYSVMDDFERLDGTRWTIVKDTNATVAVSADADNGRLLLTSEATTDDDGSSIQLPNEGFVLIKGRELWFESVLQVSDADQMDVFVGLSIAFATNPEAVLTAADRCGFQINDGNASILCKTEKSAAETSTDSAVDAVDATDLKLAMHFNEEGVVKFYIDNALVATHSANIPDDQRLAVAAMELSGNATGTKSMSIDYLMCVQERD